MKRPEIFRKRYIPDECINLKDDILCYRDNSMLVTSWKTLKPRPDFASGISLYLPEKGYKISRFSDASDNFIHYYCDIIHTNYFDETDTYVFTDLLADVIVFADERYKVLDLDELADALSNGIIDIPTATEALHKLNGLLTEITDGTFKKYADIISRYV